MTPEAAYQVLKIFIQRERRMREIVFAHDRVKQAGKLNACDNALNALEVLKPEMHETLELFPDTPATDPVTYP